MAYTLDEFEKDLLNLANDVEGGKHAKKFMKKEVGKLNTANKKAAKSIKIGKKTGNFMKGFKKGKPYKYKNDEWAGRAYNNSPHAHLINNGHRLIIKGQSKGFVEGKHFMEAAKEGFEEGYYKDVQDFIDEMIEANNL